MITIEVHDQAVRTALAALQARVANMRPVLLAIGEAMHARVDKRFSTQTGPDGAKWAPNKPATLKRKGNKPILTDSRSLRNAIVPQVSGNTLTLSAVEPYAAIHQFGGTIQRKAGSINVNHRTNAKDELLRSAIFNGKGLVFAKADHKRKLTRTFTVGAHSIKLPARPYMPVRADGTLYADEQRHVLAQIEAWLARPL